MKRSLLTIPLLFLLLVSYSSEAPVRFEEYFENKTFRYDYMFGGNDESLTVFPVQMKEEGEWAGNPNNLIDAMDYGTFRFQIFDAKSNILIYSHGFSPLFQEWQSTAEAKEFSRSAYQAHHFPFPKNNFVIRVEKRMYDGTFKSFFEQEVDPSSYFVLKEKSIQLETTKIIESGKPQEKVDIVFLAEGYTKDEMDKFINDAKRLTEVLFSKEPFKSNRSAFNITAIHSVSQDSGTDVPGEGIYKNTCFNSSFYTFDVDRYLTSSDMKTMYDVSAQVPHEHMYLLVNTKRYGGGGFYNFLTIATVDNDLTDEVFVHEFGHGFAGLADEYYNSEVAYEDYYNLKVEPWEPNITTLVDFDSKWKDMVEKNTPTPTPRTSEYNHTVGLFEGGGYMAKGIFSPVRDCRMKTNKPDGFCPVCQRAIQNVIDTYTK